MATSAHQPSAVSAASSDGATTPPNDRAYIFDALGAHPDSLAAEKAIQGWLRLDHYDVTFWSDPREGEDSSNHAGITLGDFVSMAGAGIVIINGHGAGSSGMPAEIFPSDVAGAALLHSTVAYYEHDLHWSPAWIRYGTGPHAGVNGKEQALELTPAGITHFFHGKHTGIIFTSGCGSASLVQNFDAQVFIGYLGETCSSAKASAGDMYRFFHRLAGFEGVELRTTGAAFGAGGFSSSASIDGEGGSGPSHISQGSLALAPAITEVKPAQGATVTTGKTKVTVHFDTVMNEQNPENAIDVYRCGATASDAAWSDKQSLGFMLNVPKNALGCTIKLAVVSYDARAGGDGYDAALDGNRAPSPENGAVPNGTDYLWSVTVGPARKLPPKVPTGSGQPLRCIPRAGTVCVVFDGHQVGNVVYQPNHVGVRSSVDVEWHLEWISPIVGYGVPTQLDRSSYATGTIDAADAPGSGFGPSCEDSFHLSPTNPPTLTQDPPFNSKTTLTMGVPVPVEDSNGAGSGYPSIVPVTGRCAMAGLGAYPGYYTVTVRLYPGAKITQPVIGGIDETDTPTLKSDKTTLTGTIYVVVG